MCDDLVVEEDALSCVGHAMAAATKMSSLSGTGAVQLFNRL